MVAVTRNETSRDINNTECMVLKIFFIDSQQEVRAERREDRLHDRAVNAALHGNLGKAIHLESKANASHHRLVTLYSIIDN